MQEIFDCALDISIWRAEGVGCYASDILDDLFCPTKLSDNLVVRLRCEWSMTPRMHTKLVPVHVFCLKSERTLQATRAHNEEGRLQILFIKILKQIRRVEGRAVIIGKSPGHFVRAVDNVRVPRTTPTCPPATRGICSCLWICGAGCKVCSRCEVGDLYTSRVDLCLPLLYFWRINWRGPVERRVVRGIEIRG